jgi:peptide methionine sulfoxide reductase msrA/msrB
MFKSKSLSKEVLRVIRDKGTEYPFTGEYENLDEAGTYLCRQCGLALFRSKQKFHSYCGWPSFDKEIEDAVKVQIDGDGQRSEILCQRCNAHLGHVFEGENFTSLNTRHCVNSASLDFVANLDVTNTEEAIVAAGCFWGVEYYFKKLKGVLKAESGYIGGHKENPTYEEICEGDTGHFEAVRVLYDPSVISYEQVIKYFFEIHDPEQQDGQGPDIGEQYLSAVFYYNESQKIAGDLVIELLTSKGYKIATKLLPVSVFWKAENYHQDYYFKAGKQPYCHSYTKKF